MIYVIIIILMALFASAGIACLIVNVAIFHSNRIGEKKPRLEDFGTNTFIVFHKEEGLKSFR